MFTPKGIFVFMNWFEHVKCINNVPSQHLSHKTPVSVRRCEKISHIISTVCAPTSHHIIALMHSCIKWISDHCCYLNSPTLIVSEWLLVALLQMPQIYYCLWCQNSLNYQYSWATGPYFDWLKSQLLQLHYTYSNFIVG